MTAVFEYSAFRAELEQFVSVIPTILAGHQVTARWATRVEQLLHLSETPFTMAVVGQMRSGKSSLLNALVGQNLAIVGVNETTATINWFKYASDKNANRFRVVWKDRPAEFVELRDVKHWIGNSERARSTRYLEFFSDASFLKSVNVVDTPGTRSVIQDHTRQLHDFLAIKQEGDTIREGEAADAIVYVLLPIARQTDADLLAAFESSTRIPGSTPYNSIAVIHKWETLPVDDPLAEVEAKSERIAEGLDGLISLALPVSAPLAMAAEQYSGDCDFWTSLMDLAQNNNAETLDDLLLMEDEFTGWDVSACSLSTDKRKQLRTDYPIPWPSFKVILNIARSKTPTSADDLQRQVLDASGIEQLRINLQQRFFARSDTIKAFSVLSKAWGPCRIASGGLRNYKNRMQRLLDGAEQSVDALSAAINEGTEGLEPVRAYVEKTRRVVQADVREATETLHQLDNSVVNVKDMFDDMQSDLRMLELLDVDANEIDALWIEKLRNLFGFRGPTVEDRIDRISEPAAATADTKGDSSRNKAVDKPDKLKAVEIAVGELRTYRTQTKGNVRDILSHAITRLEQIADYLD